MTLTTEEQAFLEAFEGDTLQAGGFGHHDHVRVAWLYLRLYSVPVALARFVEGIKRFVHRIGQGGLYHETITYAFIFLINERMECDGRAESWDAFAARNTDLLTQGKALLNTYYRTETLDSDLARKVFVMPASAAERGHRRRTQRPPRMVDDAAADRRR